MIISHSATKCWEGAQVLCWVSISMGLMSADLKQRLHWRPVCDHPALLGHYSTLSPLSATVRNSSIESFPIVLWSLLERGFYAQFF